MYRKYGYNNNAIETAIEQALNTLSVEDNDSIKPVQFSLKQNYPNPFNPQTKISFTLNNAQPLLVSLLIYDLMGRKVKSLVNDKLSSGFYQLNWDGLNSYGKRIKSGNYFYELRVGNQKLVKKMSLVR